MDTPLTPRGYIMSSTTIPFPDHYIEVQQRYHAGKITWAGPLTMLVTRPVLFVFWQIVMAGVQALGGAANPWSASAAWSAW